MDTLAVLPTDNLLDYPSCPLLHMLQQDPNIEIVYGEQAKPEKIDERLIDKKLFIGVGHGLSCIYTVQSMEPYIEEIGDKIECEKNLRLDKFKDMVVYLISCNTGKHLGKTLVDNGAKAFLGFDDEYLFFIGSPPCSDEANALFEAEMEALKVLLTGGSVREANEARRRAYHKIWIQWGVGEKSHSINAPLISRLALYNESILVAYGDLDYRPTNHGEVSLNLQGNELDRRSLLLLFGSILLAKIQSK